MKNSELKKLLKDAHIEITNLRKLNQNMSLRLQMFDDINIMLKTKRDTPQFGGMHPDIAYELEKASASLDSSDKEEKE